jgi:hypothetical protein
MSQTGRLLETSLAGESHRSFLFMTNPPASVSAIVTTTQQWSALVVSDLGAKEGVDKPLRRSVAVESAMRRAGFS